MDAEKTIRFAVCRFTEADSSAPRYIKGTKVRSPILGNSRSALLSPTGPDAEPSQPATLRVGPQLPEHARAD